MTAQTTGLEEAYVVDTNALYWYLTGDKKLTESANTVFAGAEQGQTRLYVSVISLAELYWILRKKPLSQTFAQIYSALKEKPYFEFVGFTPDQVLELDHDSAVPEMHDRIITGVARRLKMPLISSDALIKAAAIVTVVR
jgi:PIN domain nuclease of toxin-antitoxin system